MEYVKSFMEFTGVVNENTGKETLFYTIEPGKNSKEIVLTLSEEEDDDGMTYGLADDMEGELEKMFPGLEVNLSDTDGVYTITDRRNVIGNNDTRGYIKNIIKKTYPKWSECFPLDDDDDDEYEG